jgi:hypothetical protein
VGGGTGGPDRTSEPQTEEDAVHRAGVALVVAVLLTGTGCSSEQPCAEAAVQLSVSCAAGVSYDGHFYQQWSNLPAEKGAPLEGASYPPCNDTGGCGSGDEGPGQPTKVWELRGADPAEVVVGRPEGGGALVVFGRLDAEPRDYFRLNAEKKWVRRPAGSAARGR